MRARGIPLIAVAWAAGAVGLAHGATLGSASEVITLNCGGATISLTQGDEAISLSCGAAMLTLPARGKAPNAAKPIQPSAAPATASTVAIPAVARVPASLDAPIITLASAGDPAPAVKAAGNGNGNEAGNGASNGNGAGAGNGSETGSISAKDFYVGAGFSMSQNIGSKRADDVKFVARSDGSILAQVQTSQDRNISAMFETHYLLKNQGIFQAGASPIDAIGKLAACGPFALVGADDQRSGCGPLFTAIIDSDGKVSQFGIGWAIGLGKADPSDADSRSSFGVGLGLLFSPDSKVLDTRIVDPNTLLVRSQYQSLFSAATTGTVSALVNRPTTSAFVMVSKTF